MRLKVLFITCSMLITPMAARSTAAKTITDSKVVDLPCSQIDRVNIFEYLRQDFHHQENHFPISNWGFRAGFHKIAGCWSLSRNQRLSFYLGGYSEISANAEVTANSLNMFRRWTPRLSRQGHLMFKDSREFHLLPPTSQIFPWLVKGYEQRLTNGRHLESVIRNFRTDIETYQIHRFHNLGKNDEYLKGRRERAAAVNAASAQQIVNLLDQRALPLINVRAALTNQHILVVKDYIQLPDGRLEFRVYDSNRPFQDEFFYYNPQVRQFFAPSILRTIGDQTPDSPAGVFVVDNDELDLIHQKLKNYYSQTCKALAAKQK